MSTINGKHIMLSYAWEGGHHKVDQIAREFRSFGIPIWMDTRNGLGKDVIDGMAEAVEDSLAVCCFITPEYQESQYCEMELKYAKELKKPIIPCFLTDFHPRKWLGILIAGLIRYDFSDDVNDEVLKPLVRYIKRDILKVKSKTSSRRDRTPVKQVTLPVSTEQRHSHKTAVGTGDSDTEESSFNNDSSSNISLSLTSSKTVVNSRSSTHNIRAAMSNLSVNPTSRRIKYAKTDQQKNHNNESHDS